MAERRALCPKPCRAWDLGMVGLFVWLLAVIMVTVLPQSGRCGEDRPEPVVLEVQPSDFVSEITGRAAVESAKAVEVRCEVAPSSGYATIRKIVPEGTAVKAGDLLVELDPSALNDQLLKQQLACRTSEAAIVEARAAHELAMLAKREYEEGLSRIERKTIELEILLAEETIRLADIDVKRGAAQLAEGQASSRQLEADRFRVKRAHHELELARLKLEVLEKFTKPRMLIQLEGGARTQQAKLAAVEQTHRLNLDRLAAIQEQIANCTIKAPVSGQVVYVPSRGTSSSGTMREGARVRQRQPILRVVDPSQMQVRVTVVRPEVSQLAPGTAAKIALDAFPDQKLTGTVEKVEERGASGDRRAYQVIVRIDDPLPSLRVGLTASVTVRLEQPSVLQVPMGALVSHDGRLYCLVHKDGAFEARHVSIGLYNQKSAVITKGLKEGDPIVLNSEAFRGQAGLPKRPPEKKPSAKPWWAD